MWNILNKMTNLAKTIRIFLRLKANEIMEFFSYFRKEDGVVPMIVVYLATAMVLMAMHGIPSMIGMSMIGLFLLIICIMIIVCTVSGIICFCKWIRNNWREAKRLANVVNAGVTK